MPSDSMMNGYMEEYEFFKAIRFIEDDQSDETNSASAFHDTLLVCLDISAKGYKQETDKLLRNFIFFLSSRINTIP